MQFIKLYLLMLCINVFFFVFGSFDPTLGFTINQSDLPDIYNNTQSTNSSTLVGNLTTGSGSSNSTSFSTLDWFLDSTQRILFFLQVPLNFLFAGFIFATISSVSTSMGIIWPTGFILGLEAVIGFIFFLWLKYQITGRADSGGV